MYAGFLKDKSRNLSKIVSVLRSASVERFDVSRMRDFFKVLQTAINPKNPVMLNKKSARWFDSESSSYMKTAFSFPFWFINLLIAGFSTLPAVDHGLAMIPLMGLH